MTRLSTPDAPANSPAVEGLLLRRLALGRRLRLRGVDVAPAQVVDLVHCLPYLDLGNRQEFKDAARTVLVRRIEHLARFEEVFDTFWRETAAGADPWEGIPQRPRSVTTEWLWLAGTLSTLEAGDLDEMGDQPQVDRVLTFSAAEQLRQRDFGQMTAAELAAVQQELLHLVWQPPIRRVRRTEPSRGGVRIDLRRTLRYSLRHGGDPLLLERRTHKRVRRPLVVLCDVSGSMARYSRVLLQFVYMLAHRLDRVEVFVFGTRLTRITHQLKRRSVDEALTAAVASVLDWGGGTRIGAAIQTFTQDWAARVRTSGAVVLILSDGCDRGDATQVGREMARLRRRCHRLIWLNPWLGAPDYQPLARGMQAALPHVDEFRPVHNLVSLEQLAASLAHKDSF